jgi:hypothetical protein
VLHRVVACKLELVQEAAGGDLQSWRVQNLAGLHLWDEQTHRTEQHPLHRVNPRGLAGLCQPSLPPGHLLGI